MGVKEIKEFEDDVSEVSVAEALSESGDWSGKDFLEGEEKSEDEVSEEFSIGDTMLARGASKNVWGESGLEEELEGEEFSSVFDNESFEEEEFGGNSFSYEVVGAGENLYGASSGGNLYGTSSGGSLYGGSSNSGSLYNSSGGNFKSESSLYNVDVGNKKKDSLGVVYKIDEPKKKSVKRRGSVSGLERGVVGVRKSRGKGVSLI
jgi:hypothetical protein